MSGNFNYNSGLYNAGSFLVSGKPYLTGSTVNDGDEYLIEFPKVTKSIKIVKESAGGELRFHVAQTAVPLTPKNSAMFVSGTVAIETQPNAYTINDSSDYSLSFWHSASANSEYASNEAPFILRNGGTNGLLFRFRQTPAASFAFNQVAGGTPGTQNINIDTLVGWQHFVITCEVNSDTVYTIYQNGVSQGTATFVGTTPTGSNEFAMMRSGDAQDPGIAFDEVILWNKKLEQSEVDSVYNDAQYFSPTEVQEADMILWYGFGDNTSDVLNGASTEIFNQVNIGSLNDVLGFAAGDTIEPIGGPFYGSYDVFGNLHYWPLNNAGDTVSFDIKCNKIYLTADGANIDFKVYVELTGIDSERMYALSGSGVYE